MTQKDHDKLAQMRAAKALDELNAAIDHAQSIGLNCMAIQGVDGHVHVSLQRPLELKWAGDV